MLFCKTNNFYPEHVRNDTFLKMYQQIHRNNTKFMRQKFGIIKRWSGHNRNFQFSSFVMWGAAPPSAMALLNIEQGRQCLPVGAINHLTMPPSIFYLRYESSTLILCQELSSTIFQSCQWGIGNTCPDLHFVQYIKAWMPSTDPISSITNCYPLIQSWDLSQPSRPAVV